VQRLVLPLSAFAVAFGYEEATIVLYLRQLASGTLPGAGILALERGREASTIVILLAVAWLCSRRLAALRWRAFLFAFGVWDIAYYVFLYVLSRYPTLTSPDVLFLLPVPWVGPVWAAVSFAVLLVLIGLFGLRRRGAALFGIGLGLGLCSFLVDGMRITHSYPVALFAAGMALGIGGLDVPSLCRVVRAKAL
jgi:hypothetical protein